jgi:hypothetical protein
MPDAHDGDANAARIRQRGERARIELGLTAELGAGLRAAATHSNGCAVNDGNRRRAAYRRSSAR